MSPDVLWRAIEPHKDYYSKEIIFDGGVKIPALLSPECNNDSFRTEWQTIIPVISNIRNVIAHSREKRLTLSILPNQANSELMHPWVKVIQILASQVMIH